MLGLARAELESLSDLPDSLLHSESAVSRWPERKRKQQNMSAGPGAVRAGAAGAVKDELACSCPYKV